MGCSARSRWRVVCTTDDPAGLARGAPRARRAQAIPTTRVVSHLAPRRGARIRRSRPGTPGSDGWRRRRTRTVAHVSTTLSRRSTRATRAFHDAGLPRLRSRPGDDAPPTPYADAEVARPSTACARARRSTATRRSALQVGAAPSLAPSWTTRAAGCSSSTSARYANINTRAAPRSSAPTRARLDRRLRDGARRWPRSSIGLDEHEPAGQDHPLQPEPARQRAVRHHGRQLPGRLACRARCSTARPGGSSIRRTA